MSPGLFFLLFEYILMGKYSKKPVIIGWMHKTLLKIKRLPDVLTVWITMCFMTLAGR